METVVGCFCARCTERLRAAAMADVAYHLGGRVYLLPQETITNHYVLRSIRDGFRGVFSCLESIAATTRCVDSGVLRHPGEAAWV